MARAIGANTRLLMLPESTYGTAPGDYHMKPGWGWVHGYLGFRHGGKMGLSYLDGHCRAFDKEELKDYSNWPAGHGYPEEVTGDFMFHFVGEDSCHGSHDHSSLFPGKIGDAE